MPQLFFTSYAHINRDGVLERFVKRLREEVLQRGPGGLKPEDVVFFDSEGIQTGEQWVKKLSAAVSECKVCVAICSPAYITSEFCGKEIQVFLSRLKEWETAAGNAGVPKRTIIPIIWVKAALPDVLNEFQYNEKEFPKEYIEHGLRTLCQLSTYKNKRQKIEITLAERIIAAANQNLPSGGPIPHFDLLASIFHVKTTGSRYGVAIIPLLAGEALSKPYGGPLTLRNLLDDACGSRIPWRELAQDRKLTDHIANAKQNREAIVIMTDLETLKNPLYQKSIAAVDQAAGDQSALLLIGPADQLTAAQEQDIEMTVQGAFPNLLPKVWLSDVKRIRSLQSLRVTLEEMIAKMRGKLVGEDPGREASDPAIVAAANAEGVPLERQPIVTGPGGKPGT
jgi:hypothetical protein